jgi:hypothetical protein
MRTIELDVRPIPQLYGSSYSNPHEGEINRHFNSPKLFGSCLSASLEMLIDFMRRDDRTPGYSSFKNAGTLQSKLTRQGHPNGDKTVHLMWNQATLHNTIYGSSQALVDLVGLDYVEGGFGMRTTSVSKFKLSEARNETCEVATDDVKLIQFIKDTLFQRKQPMIALIENGQLKTPSQEFPYWDRENRPPMRELPESKMIDTETEQFGHAVVIAGIFVPFQPIDHAHPINGVELLILDPSPSIELENNPERFYNPPAHLIDPAFHVHRVNAASFLRKIQPERGLIWINERQ